MTDRTKVRIETQSPRRKKVASPVELKAEWEAQQGIRTTGLKMTSDAMVSKKIEAPTPPTPSSAETN